MRKTSEHIDTRKNKSGKYTEGKRKGKKAMYGYMCKVINDFFSFPSPVLGGFFYFSQKRQEADLSNCAPLSLNCAIGKGR